MGFDTIEINLVFFYFWASQLPRLAEITQLYFSGLQNLKLIITSTQLGFLWLGLSLAKSWAHFPLNGFLCLEKSIFDL